MRSLKLLFLLIILAPFAVWAGFYLRRPKATPVGEGRMRVTVINVGQGEATLIRTPSGGTILIGAGPTETGREVVDTLQTAGVKRIDLLILPYPYAEAIGGVPYLYDAFEIKTILEPGGERLNAYITNAQRLAHEFQTEWWTEQSGRVFNFPSDDVKVEVLAPFPADRNRSAPDASLVVAVRYKKTRFLFAGGLGSDGERHLLSHLPNLKSDWLRVARSGAGDASSFEFLRLVKPAFTVISVGPNEESIPSPLTIQRLKATGATLYRTDENGGQNLTFWSDGQQITAEK